jgi:glycosyltransferase involved in cell wall biosynthesis
MIAFLLISVVSASNALLPVHSPVEARLNMSVSHLIVGAVARDVAPYLQNILTSIDKAGHKFASYQVIIYENDSRDQTREILQAHAGSRIQYSLIFETGVTESSRTHRLANARNKVLDTAKSLHVSEPAYLLLLDVDDVNAKGTFADSIDTCFHYGDWDALFANQRGVYYDLWALREPGGLDYDIWERAALNHDTWESIDRWRSVRLEQDPLIPVMSAFGGGGLYRLAAIPQTARYSGETCEHVSFHAAMVASGSSQLFINTKFFNDHEESYREAFLSRSTSVIHRLSVLGATGVFGISLIICAPIFLVIRILRSRRLQGYSSLDLVELGLSHRSE